MSARRWPPRAAANRAEAWRERLRVMIRSMKTVREARPIASNRTATMTAGHPMCDHISLKLKPMRVPFCCVLRRQLERDLDHPEHRDRLTLVTRRLILPPLHRIHRGADEGFVSLQHLNIRDRSVREYEDLQHDHPRLLGREGLLRVGRSGVLARRDRGIGVLRDPSTSTDHTAGNPSRVSTLEASHVTVVAVAVDGDPLVEARIRLLRRLERHLFGGNELLAWRRLVEPTDLLVRANDGCRGDGRRRLRDRRLRRRELGRLDRRGRRWRLDHLLDELELYLLSTLDDVLGHRDAQYQQTDPDVDDRRGGQRRQPAARSFCAGMPVRAERPVGLLTHEVPLQA